MSAGLPPRSTIATVVDALIATVDVSVLWDLAFEDPTTAVEIHFAPLRVLAMPDAGGLGDECATDGCYEASIDATKPCIVHDASVGRTRAHFTILHELAHHLFATTAAHLLDDLDRIGGSAQGAKAAEERACHEFAGRVLVPDEVMDRVLGDVQILTPDHLVELHDATRASWDAIAVRCVNRMPSRVAVVLLRTPGIVAGAVASPKLGGAWWPAGSSVAGGGAMARAFGARQTARKDTYRFGHAYAEQLYCDTVQVHDGLAIAVLADRRSDGRFDLLEPATPAWQDREEFCAFDGDERDVGWCDQCRGHRCRTCGRCGCTTPAPQPICPGCSLPAPKNPDGGSLCRTCVLDGRVL